MLSPFICGSFHHQEEEDDQFQSPCSTPRRSSKKSSKDKNPYSTRGLDKFSALLSDLEQKRQKIYSQVGSQDISFVRFVYSSSNDCVPIIVKMKDNNKAETKEKKNSTDNQTESLEKPKIESLRVFQEHEQRLELEKKKQKKKWELKLHRLRRPSVYMPIFVILILVLLVFFGRSVAILCTSIGWYLVPTLSSKRLQKPAIKKKKLIRRYSELAPTTNTIEDEKEQSNHGRQNSF